MVPDLLATITAPESRAVMYSMPVPTNGARARSSGTAWRCMFDPISARLASSFSRNGINDAATETSCFGDTSMNWTLSRWARMKLPAWRELTRSCVSLPLVSPGAFARQTAGSEGGKAALVRDFRQRVRLIHELRELRRSKELANRGHHRLGVDQVVRHRRRHFLVDRHLLLDGALHPDQTDAELVLEELADGADAAVAQVIDVVDVRRIPPQLEQVLDDLVEVLRVQDLLVERRVEPELRVELQPADAREVVLLRVEEHVLEERPRAVERRRIAGTQAAVDLDERFFVRVDRILLERLADDRADLVALGEEDIDAVDVLLLRHRHDARFERLVRLEDHFAGRRIDDVGGGEGAFELGIRDLDRLDVRLLERLDRVLGDLLALLDREVLAGDDDVLGGAQADEAVADAPVNRSVLQEQ